MPFIFKAVSYPCFEGSVFNQVQVPMEHCITLMFFLLLNCFVDRNQQYGDSDRIAPLGTGYEGVNYPLRKTGQEYKFAAVIISLSKQ